MFTNRLTAVLAVLAGIMLATLLIGAASVAATSEPEMPEVVFLGEGPETFHNDTGDFIIKTKNSPEHPWEFEVKNGPQYNAKRGQRIWATSGTDAPMRVFEETSDLGMVEAGCSIDFVVIDDDLDERRVNFAIDGIDIETTPQGMVSYGRFDVESDGLLTVSSEDSIGLWWAQRCEPPPQTYLSFMPIVAGKPLPPPPPAACEDESLLASINNQSAELPFEPWPGIDRDYGIHGPSQILSLNSASGRLLDWEVSEGAQAYQYLTDAASKGFVAYWPNKPLDWFSDPVTLNTHKEYHLRSSFIGQDGTLCMVSGWFQVDPPEENRVAEMSAKPAGLRPVDWK